MGGSSVLRERDQCGVCGVLKGHRSAAGDVRGERVVAEGGASRLSVSRKEGLFEVSAD
jgi:hypothetical protein